jgi:16S rRNA (cytosine1402-N4)-methyltransferase
MEGRFHEPVLVDEVLEVLSVAREGLILDGTLGGGGHTEAMLRRWPGCRVLGVDRDPEAIKAAAERLTPFLNRVRFLEMRFDHATDDAEVRRDGLDGALLDLGVSSWQLDEDRRGFTFRRGQPLDMRMDGAGPTAADLLNHSSEEELARVFKEYGEAPKARRLAREVIRRRARHPFRNSDDLVAAQTRALDRSPGTKEKARIFQALRISVNDELESLEKALPQLRDSLKPSGVLVTIAYHSLEDRIVKDAFREWSRECVCPPGLPVCVCRGESLGAPAFKGLRRPSTHEVATNPRSRSARLRAWQRAG